jgi:hypothetical protein
MVGGASICFVTSLPSHHFSHVETAATVQCGCTTQKLQPKRFRRVTICAKLAQSRRGKSLKEELV